MSVEGQILKVNLSDRSSRVETIPAKAFRNYLGGRGLGAYLLTKAVAPRVDPLGEENHLIFTAGAANGTELFFGAKSVVTTKSPLTNIYLYSISGGTFCSQLRKAGLWALDVSGISESPVYLSIDNGGVAFHDARPLWGMKVLPAQEAMRGDLTAGKASTIAIGPAGEKLISYAAIMAEGPTYRAFGRGGAGCVMGAKKLKGIVISGDRVVVPANREGLRAVHRTILENIRAHSQWADTRRQYGTGADMVQMGELGMLPTNNWRQGHYQDVAAICTSTMEWPRQNISCGPHCPAPCSHYIEIKKGPYRGANCDGPEYETIYAFGSSCGVNKFDAIVRAGQICDENGLDTMSAGLTISFAMECFEKGLIGVEDTQGVELRFGNDGAVIKVLEQLVSGVGFGARLAGGSRKLAREIGRSEAFAMQVKGMELGGYECRGLMGQALQFAINNRGGCHHAYGLTARAEVADGTRMQIAGKGEQVKKAAISRILRDSIPMCTFPGLVVTDAMLPEILSSLSGENLTSDELRQVGNRIICQERFFNMREGLTRADDTLPLRLLEEAKPDGPTKGATVPLEVLKDDYYRAMGWDLSSGNPSDSLLGELEIER